MFWCTISLYIFTSSALTSPQGESKYKDYQSQLSQKNVLRLSQQYVLNNNMFLSQQYVPRLSQQYVLSAHQNVLSAQQYVLSAQ